ncbi:MAG: hypothetical protein OES26_20915 [Gammaproteobacteria bacterium]|nr:hypothetical protein [Gammaproteobacteria bacterium]
MSLLDVLARWLLDKLDKKFLEKKEFTTGERIQALHYYLNVLLDTCQTYKYVLGTHEEEKNLDDINLKTINGTRLIDTEIKLLQKRLKKKKKILAGIGEQVKYLGVDFDRERHPELKEIIMPCIGIFIELENVERYLANVKKGLYINDGHHFPDYKRDLRSSRAVLTKHEEWLESTIESLLEFARQMK